MQRQRVPQVPYKTRPELPLRRFAVVCSLKSCFHETEHVQAPPSSAPCWGIHITAHVEVLHPISALEAGPCMATPRPHNLQQPNEQKDSKAQSLLTVVSEALRTGLTKR